MSLIDGILLYASQLMYSYLYCCLFKFSCLLTAEQSLQWSIKEGILCKRQYAISSRSLTSDSFLKGSDLYQVFTCRYTFLFEFFFKEVIHFFLQKWLNI